MFNHSGIRETKLMLLARVLASSNLVMPVGGSISCPDRAAGGYGWPGA